MPPDARHLLDRLADPPWTLRGMAGGTALLLVIGHWSAVVTTLRFVLDNLLAMAPVILFAAGLAAALRASGADTALAATVRARQTGTVVAAAAAGALTPICGVGVLPLIAGLLRSGVPLAPVMAFWLSSPVTDPAMFALTAATLGTGFAVTKSALAFFIGIAGGFTAAWLARLGWLAHPLRQAAVAPVPADCTEFSFSASFWTEARRRRVFAADARAGLLMIAGWLAAAFAAESVIRAQMSAETVSAWLGPSNTFAIPLAVAAGAPIYVDGYGALPLVRGLIDLGMTPGAAMGFLVAGGIVSLYASLAAFAVVRLPVFLLYIALALALSLAGACFYDVIAR